MMTKNLDIDDFVTFKQENGCVLQIRTGLNGLEVRASCGYHVEMTPYYRSNSEVAVWSIGVSGQPDTKADTGKVEP